MYETTFEVDHINTAETIMGIGLTYHNQGKYDEAISQNEPALRIKERALEVNHINTTPMIIMNIGLLHKSGGRAQLAEL